MNMPWPPLVATTILASSLSMVTLEKNECQRRRGFRNPLKASFFSLNRKFGGILVKIPVGF